MSDVAESLSCVLCDVTCVYAYMRVSCDVSRLSLACREPQEPYGTFATYDQRGDVTEPSAKCISTRRASQILRSAPPHGEHAHVPRRAAPQATSQEQDRTQHAFFHAVTEAPRPPKSLESHLPFATTAHSAAIPLSARTGGCGQLRCACARLRCARRGSRGPLGTWTRRAAPRTHHARTPVSYTHLRAHETLMNL
eukprot:1989785-Prymnesium_polylepis.2